MNFKFYFTNFLILISFFNAKVFGIKKEPTDKIDGHYTSDINSYQFLVPHKVSNNGEFLSYSLPHYFQHDYTSRRRRRDDLDRDVVHYNLHFHGKDHIIQLWPNHGFISPRTTTEFYYPGSGITVRARKIQQINPTLCHYTGTIRGVNGSKAALSLCEGLAGYIKTPEGMFYVEPVKDFGPNELGHQLHIIYPPEKIKENPINENESKIESVEMNCGTEDWTGGWNKAFEQHLVDMNLSNRNDYFKQHNLTRRKSHQSFHRYLEVLVVADKAFLDFHKDKDYENYILTVMNMVSDYFHDASTGNEFDVVIVRIIYLDENISALDLSITSDSSETLKSFCKWQNEINPKDVEHPQHHDMAILITRQDICFNESHNCDLLGLAYMASACVPSYACSINEDKGLVLGVVVAHELGHIMGCDHDIEGKNGCSPKADKNFFHVMSPHVSLATSQWSTCSKAYMTELLENNLGECLTDEPKDSPYKYFEMLPGTIYDADYQCSLNFQNSSHCPMDSEIFCERLFCQVSTSKCRSNGEPPVDGTHCGANKWCYKSKCVTIGERPNSTDGGWSDWPDYGPCSRTCGGGIQMSERSCNNPLPQNGGIYCNGDSKQIKICNTQPCDLGSPSFRSFQCSEFNEVPRNGQFYNWTPFIPATKSISNACALFCINDELVYSKLSPRVKDGTPCNPGTNDMCITGKCRKVGCDWRLDSENVNDKCGICNGDNTGCQHITGSYTEAGSGYTKVTMFPKGSRNILVRETKPSGNTIAIANADGTFLLNGDNREESDGEKYLDKNIALYMHLEPDKEELYLAGPILSELVFYVVFYEPNNFGFDYEYYLRDNNFSPKTLRNTVDLDTKNPEKKCNHENKFKYHWEFVEWSECTLRCDAGESYSEPVCISSQEEGIVSSDYCSENDDKPEKKTKICNRRPCEVRWNTGDWSACTGCKHKSGFQARHVGCVRESSRWEETDIATSETKCVESAGPKPKSRQLCIGSCGPACSRFDRNIRFEPIFDPKFYTKFYQRIDTLTLKPRDVHNYKTKRINSKKHMKNSNIHRSDKNAYESVLNDMKRDLFKSTNQKCDTKKCCCNSKVLKYPESMFLLENTDSKRGHHRNSRDSNVNNSPHPVIEDRIGKNDIVLIEAPFHSDSNIQNLSDEAFEKLGDKISGSLDLNHVRNYKGDEAIEQIKQDVNKCTTEESESD